MEAKQPVIRKVIKLDSLKDAAHNPPNRVSDKNTRKLMESIEMIGLLHPITVTRQNVIIDGHRRVSACRQLDWTEIECNIVDRDPDEVYGSVNVTARRLSGNDALGVWLKNHRAVGSRTNDTFKRVESVIGRVLMRKIFDAGLSSRVVSTAQRIARYCQETNAETIKAIVEWLLEFAIIGQVMKAMDAGEDPRLILKAVRAKKPVTMKLTIAG